ACRRSSSTARRSAPPRWPSRPSDAAAGRGNRPLNGSPTRSLPMARVDADRNLLFGILALQMDFITRDDLVAAMNAWVLDKRRSLGQVLQERGAIDGQTLDVLEALVRRHLELHGDDAGRSL